MQTFNLSIRTPDQEVFVADNITSVNTITESGPITIYAGHADLTGKIPFSTLTAHANNGEEKFMLRRGTIFVDNNKKQVVVLAMAGDALEHVQFEDVEQYLAFINEKIEEGGEGISEMRLKYLEEEKLAISQQLTQMKK